MQAVKLNEQQKVDANERAWTLDWHPEGHALISAGASKNFTLWKYDNDKLQKVTTVETDHNKTIRTIKFSHKGDKIAVGSFDQTISVWIFNNESKQYQILSTLSGHINQVKCVSWSPDDHKIASCSRDKNIWIWQFDTISYDYVCDAVLEGHTQDVKFIQWFPTQARKLVSASYDDTIRIWEAQDDDYVCSQVLEGHKSIVWCIQILNNYLFSASEDCTVIQWVLDSQTQKYSVKYIYEGLHVLPIYTLCIINNKYIATGSADNSINVCKIVQENATNQKNIKPQILSTVYHQSDVNCLKVNPKFNSIFASCSDDESIKILKFIDSV